MDHLLMPSGLPKGLFDGDKEEEIEATPPALSREPARVQVHHQLEPEYALTKPDEA